MLGLVLPAALHISEGVLIAGIGAFAAIASAGFGAVAAITSARASAHAKRAAISGSRTAADAAVIREQVQNDHTTNLREEADERHGQNSNKLDAVLNALNAVRNDVGGVRSDIRQLYRQDNDIRGDLDVLRDTIPKEIRDKWQTTPQTSPTPDSEASEPSPKD